MISIEYVDLFRPQFYYNFYMICGCLGKHVTTKYFNNILLGLTDTTINFYRCIEIIVQPLREAQCDTLDLKILIGGNFSFFDRFTVV